MLYSRKSCETGEGLGLGRLGLDMWSCVVLCCGCWLVGVDSVGVGFNVHGTFSVRPSSTQTHTLSLSF